MSDYFYLRKATKDNPFPSVREYIVELGGNKYFEYHGNSVIGGSFCACTDSTMKQWGRRITKVEALEHVPNLEEIRKVKLIEVEAEIKRNQDEEKDTWAEINKAMKRNIISNMTIQELEEELKKRRN